MNARFDRTRPATAKADIGTLATMSNLKILVPQSGSDLLLIEKSFAVNLLEKLISTIYVEDTWYRSKYPDIAAHLDQGILKSCKEHYVKFGYFEHRMPYNIEVNEDWYLTEYPDIRAAVRRDTFTSGQEHFELMGFREGRLPFANFALQRA